MTTQHTRWSQFGVLITVFFFWGFVAASNEILIPVFKHAFDLTQAQSQLVSVAFYVAYTVGSLIYVAVSKALGVDLLNRIGYKNGICLGLVVSAIGTLLFYPAANAGSFNLMLSGLFVVGLGFSLQQIAANPLAIVMGDPRTGSQRLTMAGGINNFGTTIGPLLVSIAIFGSVAAGGTEASIESVKVPYLILGVAFLLVAVFLKFSSVPNHIDLEGVTESEAQDSDKLIHKSSALAYPQLVLGMIAIFVYVGVEVSTISNLPAYLEESHGVPISSIAPYVSLYWASLMIGRWTGAAGAFDVGAGAKRMLTLILPYLAFGVFLAVNSIARHDVSQFYGYAFVIVLMIAATFASRGNLRALRHHRAVDRHAHQRQDRRGRLHQRRPVLQHDVALHLRPRDHRPGPQHQPGQQPADHDDHGRRHRQLDPGRGRRQPRHPVQLHRRRRLLRLPRLLRLEVLAPAPRPGHRPRQAREVERALIARRSRNEKAPVIGGFFMAQNQGDSHPFWIFIEYKQVPRLRLGMTG